MAKDHELDVDALVRAFEATEEFRRRTATAADVPTTFQRITRHQAAKVGYWATAVPTLVSGLANISAHQWPGWEVPFTGGLVSALATVATVAGLNHNWNPAASAVAAGIALGGLQFATAAGSGGWMEVVAWITGAAGTVAYAIVWNRKHAKDRAEVALVEAKRRTEILKGDAVKSASALKDTHLLLKIQAEQRAQQAAVAPVFQGATQVERDMRRAVWDAFGVNLMSCDVRDTRTGWVATCGMPVELSRNAARSGWDKVSSALRLDGRFIISDGRLSNELDVKFLDRSKVDTRPMIWTPDRMHDDPQHFASLGINTETGEPVAVQFDERLLICGASGTGKSWSTRPLLAHAHLNGSLIMLDGKGEEGNVWDGICRVGNETDEIVWLIRAVHEEMQRRKRILKDKGLSVWTGEQLTVFVDEGQVILALLKGDAALMQQLRELASLGRSRGIVLWWATQKPTMSGSAPGIDSQMAGNLLQRFALRVATENEARTALDDCAHYGPQSIPDDRAMRGHGYLKGYGPALLRTWTMDDAAVRSLPVSVWSGELDEQRAAAESETLRRAAEAAVAGTPLERVAAVLLSKPDATKREVAALANVPEGSAGHYMKKVRGAG